MLISQSDFEAIAALDLDPIKVKLMHRESGEGWSLEQADEIETEYRRFLYLMKEFPNELAAPRFDVDIFWHYHILDTVKYAQDCDAVFGYFLHHFPYVGLRGEEDLEMHHRVGQRMRELYEETFGEPYVRGTELAPATTTGLFEATGKIEFSSAAPGTAYSVRAPGPVAATDTAYSVRAPGPVAATGTAYSVRAPGSVAATDTAYSVRAPGSVAATGTAYSVRALASIAQAQTAYSVRAPRPLNVTQIASSPSTVRSPPAAPADPRQIGESAGDENENSLAGFYWSRPRLDTAGAPQWAQ